ncbi:MAG: hypothetical protein A2167_01490 [Planctomycetes bacterium RBG_13_46_10]|nr:MAG: hypothetical protein A2167_01490 [Planctomycetes bacterium RBG_13_46_10]
MRPVKVSDDDFHELIAQRAKRLLSLANYLSSCSSNSEFLIRSFLGEFFSQSLQIEELLDAYDARNNCKWCPFRSLIAATKLFSNVGYELLHIRHAVPAYRLLPVGGDFAKATQQTLDFTGEVLTKTAKHLLSMACRLNLPVPSETESEPFHSEEMPPARLPRDCKARRAETVSEMVTMLATAFLNLAAGSKDVRSATKAKPHEYPSYIENSITEESLRTLELRFHNLQSQYDTYVAGSEAEQQDTDLLVLRGHISVVFHLLRTATSFAHYYERHLNKKPCEVKSPQELLLQPNDLLFVLMNYSITYISLYIDCAENLCRQMLKRYAEISQIEVCVPPYRGFHVRPATLISKLALHYGSEVYMQLDEERYDAGSALELFRVNEKINAQKRKFVAAEIIRLKLVPQWATGKDLKTIIHDTISTLAKESKLILYEQPLQISDIPIRAEGTLLEKVIDEVAQLLALGKIDINTDMTVTFIGDKRVLADIKLLAEAGYGEDSLGNNISLPEKLSYLRR